MLTLVCSLNLFIVTKVERFGGNDLGRTECPFASSSQCGGSTVAMIRCDREKGENPGG